MNDRNDMSADDAFAEKAKALFDDSVASLDGATQSRLTRARHEALKELDRSRPARAQWIPATGVAAAAALAFVLWNGGAPVDDIPDQATASDMEILLTEDSLEMLEDLEFYSWIELNEETDELEGPANNVG